MRYSKSFSKTLRQIPHEEESKNAQLLIRGGFTDKVMAGVYTFLPLGFKVLQNIEKIIREEMENIGGQEILMPTLQPKDNWEKTGRWDTYDSLFRFTSYFSKIDYVLGPTHEEIISPLGQKNIFSYKDLPLYVFQIQNKFRDEKRAKSGILRGREFLMKDLYSFHTDEKDLEEYYEKVKEVYFKIFKRAGIGDSTYLTFASGGAFSKYSHEFQTLTSAGEDTIFLCKDCKVAINREIIDEQNKCPQCGKSDFSQETAIEVGNIFKLGTRFSEPFGLKYKDSDGSEKNVIMGCYGIGLNRLMGTIVEVHNDERGIIWPESVAPYKVHLIEIKKRDEADRVYETLEKEGIEVLYDDRDVSPGEKFSDADLIGIPYRFVVSEKNGGKIEVKKRAEEKAELLSLEEALKLISK